MSSAGINVALGGLVGFNAPGSIIFGSSASGDVIATASVNKGGQDCGFSNSCQHVSAGGLVGDNFGTIASSFAIGDVFVGANGTAGGLVGFNTGVIANAFAAGNVTGAPGTGGVDGDGGSTTLGGLAGINQGVISNSAAIGDVGGPNVANLQAGGLVGDNSGAILSSSAFGNVQAGDGSNAGGLVASNSVNNFNCSGCMLGDGSPYFNTASIFDSHAFGDVTVGSDERRRRIRGRRRRVHRQQHRVRQRPGRRQQRAGRLHRRAELRERRRRDPGVAVRRDQSPAPDPTASSAGSPA